jgi:hypothetical protein
MLKTHSTAGSASFVGGANAVVDIANGKPADPDQGFRLIGLGE